MKAKAASKPVQRVNNSPLIQRIAAQFKDNSRKDIDKWRQANALALHPEHGRRDLLVNLYKDLSTDGHLKSQLELRKAATLNTPFEIVDHTTGKANESLSRLFNRKWFYDLLGDLLDTLFYGHTVVEFTAFQPDNIVYNLIPRTHVVPAQQAIILDLSYPNKKVYYTHPNYQGWFLETGKKHDLGLLNNIVPNLIWKRNVMQSWAEFCERFGIPMITATTPRQTNEALEDVEAMLQQLGEAAYAVFPEGTNIEFKEANRADAYQVFDANIEANTKETSKIILGGAMISDNGNSYSQSEVHERNLEKRLAVADRRNITFTVNNQLIPLLKQRGYAFTSADTFRFSLTRDIGIKEHYRIVSDMIKEGYEVDSKWLSKTFNVPIKGRNPSLQKSIANHHQPTGNTLADTPKTTVKTKTEPLVDREDEQRLKEISKVKEMPNKKRFFWF